MINAGRRRIIYWVGLLDMEGWLLLLVIIILAVIVRTCSNILNLRHVVQGDKEDEQAEGQRQTG